MNELWATPVAELSRKLADRECSTMDVLESFVDRIESLEPKIDAFLTLNLDAAKETATAAQEALDAGSAGPLTGIPVAIKDNIVTKGLETNCASRILEGFVPPYDAHVMEALRGSPILGKTNMDEFAMGTSTEHSAFKPTRNPWDLSCSPGGSSGGSAAAVAAGMAPLALGSDTGGSIRQPAALCGLVGFKPTYGRVSRYGLVAFGSSLDQIGPFGRSVEDAALLAAAISGHDRRDSTSIPESKIAIGELQGGSLNGMRFRVPRETMGDAINPEVAAKVNEAIELLKSEGAIVEPVAMESVRLGVSTYYIIAPAEASSNLARFDGVRYGPRIDAPTAMESISKTRGALFGHEVKARIMIGTYALSAGYYDAYYIKAQRVRAMMTSEIEATLGDCDFLLSPTSPCTAFELGRFDRDPLALKALDLCTIPANMGGFPAISLPCGLVDGLPVGLQILGPVMSDERLLQTARAVERALPAAERPSLA